MIDPRDVLICKLYKRQLLAEMFGFEADGSPDWPSLDITEMRLLEFALSTEDEDP